MRRGMCVELGLGKLCLVEEDGVLVRLDGGDLGEEDQGGVTDTLQRAMEELREYEAGRRREFTVLVRTQGTDFQRRVWEALRQIPYGEVRSYGEIAAQIGCPGGARAVGQACNRNPVMIIVPCHRVIGSNGKLTGFGGGLPMKEKLLRLEGSCQ